MPSTLLSLPLLLATMTLLVSIESSHAEDAPLLPMGLNLELLEKEIQILESEVTQKSEESSQFKFKQKLASKYLLAGILAENKPDLKKALLYYESALKHYQNAFPEDKRQIEEQMVMTIKDNKARILKKLATPGT